MDAGGDEAVVQPGDYDVAILGGGLAGLSLAVRLAAIPSLRVIVIEPRTAYPRDRTWCYWRLADHPFDGAISARWASWEVRKPGPAGRPPSVAVQTCPGLPYEMIPADRFYEAAQGIIRRSHGVELALGTRARSIADGPDGVAVETDRGGLRAGLVFDSRPPAGAPGTLVQRFLGQEIAVSRPVFDPGRVTLMDFAVPQQPGVVHFLYLLPTSPTEALVEDTWLAPAEAKLPDFRTSIRAYLAERFGVSDFETRFEEEGAIPMDPGLQAPRQAGRVIPIGTAGGAVKPSSGYGFLATQRMTEALARDLAAGRRPAPFQPRGRTARFLDDVFLAALRRSSGEAGDVFHALFARCPPASLLRFLNDVGRPLDIARVIAATPKAVMLAAAAAQARG